MPSPPWITLSCTAWNVPLPSASCPPATSFHFTSPLVCSSIRLKAFGSAVVFRWSPAGGHEPCVRSTAPAEDENNAATTAAAATEPYLGMRRSSREAERGRFDRPRVFSDQSLLISIL